MSHAFNQMSQVHDLVASEIRKCYEMAKAAFGAAPDPLVDFRGLKGRIVGRAWGYSRIDVNMPAALAMGEEYREVVTHEYAHILSQWLSHNHPPLSPLSEGSQAQRSRDSLEERDAVPGYDTRSLLLQRDE